jgi:V/A-type H+-transporting ATPase subunit A
MLRLIKTFYDCGQRAVAAYAELDDILSCPAKEKIGRAKYIEEKDIASLDDIRAELEREIGALEKGDENV